MIANPRHHGSCIADNATTAYPLPLKIEAGHIT